MDYILLQHKICSTDTMRVVRWWARSDDKRMCSLLIEQVSN
jgi:hypothetical protein